MCFKELSGLHWTWSDLYKLWYSYDDRVAHTQHWIPGYWGQQQRDFIVVSHNIVGLLYSPPPVTRTHFTLLAASPYSARHCVLHKQHSWAYSVFHFAEALCSLCGFILILDSLVCFQRNCTTAPVAPVVQLFTAWVRVTFDFVCCWVKHRVWLNEFKLCTVHHNGWIFTQYGQTICDWCFVW